MSSLMGVLGLGDVQEDFLHEVGHSLIFDATQMVLEAYRKDLDQALGVFVAGITEDDTKRWLMPGAGMMSPASEFAAGPAVSRHGEWDVAFPLRTYEEAVAGSRDALARMTVGEYDSHLDGIMMRNKKRHLQRILIALFENTALTWTDPVHGNLTIQRLANGDAVVYPPVPGSTTEAVDDHYDEANFTIAQIAAGATNPCILLRNEIVEHFGGRQSGGEEILILHNADATPYLAAIAGYVPVPDRWVNYGDDTDLSQMLAKAPGMLHGRLTGTWMTEWAEIPATFMIAVHLAYPPLLRRVPRAGTGLPRGLTLVATDDTHPLRAAYYADRFGYAVANRLSAACWEIVADDDGYVPPTSPAYSE